jgi:Helix-turn-helix domain
MGDVYLLSTYEYREWVRIHEESMPVLREKFQAQQHPSLEQIPSLVSAVKDLVAVLSSQQQPEASQVPDAFGVQVAARKLGCGPQQVRELVRQGKLLHHWNGKNLRFRMPDLEAFWASQTSAGADKKGNSPNRLSRKTDPGKIKTEQSEDKKSESPPVFPSTKEIKKLWQ